jgi:two-component system, chemotaxis family, protein-glutamate methylesterase/glutaminase
MGTPLGHDVIAVGASAGGLGPLRTLVGSLPGNFPAAVLVVMHIGTQASRLADILDDATALPVADARSGEALKPGRVYVAVPDLHLLLHDAHILLRRGPHENRARPAIDPLFRSAACSFGARVIGVLLSGALDDGVAGLRAIKRCGGLTVIQDPAEAAVPCMPQSARRHVSIDGCVGAAAMGSLLATLVASPADAAHEIPSDICFEAAIAAQELGQMTEERQLGTPSRFVCPECGGTLWEIPDGDMLRYRCHLGHAYTANVVHRSQGDEIEALLMRLLRTHRDHAQIARRLAEHQRKRRKRAATDEWEERARGYDEDAQLIERLLSSRNKE